MVKKILIVDDSPISVKIMKSCMPKDQGYELIDGNNGLVGLEKYKENKPDITFMDLTMPVMDGYEALGEIIKYDQKALVIIVTADVQPRAIARANELGAFTVLKKPPNKEAIAAVIEEAKKALEARG